jgi:class 3 adenylate cyclase/HAMP domain-containing protein
MANASSDWPMSPGDRSGPEFSLSRWLTPLKPLIDSVAAIRASVHVKLLSGFLVGALLLLGMAVLNFVVIERMSGRVHEIEVLQQKVDLARQLKYEITIQSHHRAMALLTQDPKFNQDIADDKARFAADLDAAEKLERPDQKQFFAQVRAANADFAASSDEVLRLYQAHKLTEAASVHLKEEHPKSHVLEHQMDMLTDQSLRDMAVARAGFQADASLLRITVGLIALASLALAALLALVLSWAIIRPVRQIDSGLARIAGGDFRTWIQVLNRDEFGTLTRNLNAMTMQLSNLYGKLQTLNAGLEDKVKEQLSDLERASSLRRYLSPQLADSILTGEMEVGQKPRRRNLTVLCADISDFATLSLRVEADELVDMLNEYLTTMTEIVFEHGGSLDKYIGHSLIAFFGDPVAVDDHPARAVRAALQMRSQVTELQKRWHVLEQSLNVGVGISTGYVTVGNIGSPSRLEYTVIGSHVNLATRLADRAKPGQILIAERTLVGVREFVDAVEVFNVRLQGVSRRLAIYEINPQGKVGLTVVPGDVQASGALTGGGR